MSTPRLGKVVERLPELMKLTLKGRASARLAAGAVLLALIALWLRADTAVFSLPGTNVVMIDAKLSTPFPTIETNAGTFGINQTFDIGIDVTTAAESYRGFQWKLAWDDAVLDFNFAQPTLPSGWLDALAAKGPSQPPGKEAAWGGAVHPTTASTPTAKFFTVQLKCVAPGTTSLHLESLAEDPHFGTATAKKPNEPHSMAFQDATVTCDYLTDLRLTKTAPASVAVAPGVSTTLTYNLSVLNAGPDNATGVTVVDTLPPGVTFSSASAGCSYNVPSTHKVTCDLTSISFNATKAVSITVNVAAALAGKSLVNQATVSGGQSDLTPSNNTSQATTTVSQSNVNISKTVPDQVPVGASGQYQIVVSSTGPSAAGQVVVTDVLASALTYVSHSTTQGSCSYNAGTRTVTCQVGDMAVTSSATVTIDVTFPGTDDVVCNKGIVDWTATPAGHKETVLKCTIVGDNPDADGDGCANVEELGSNPALGGLRDPSNPWDFYDVPAPTAFSSGTLADRDKAISIGNDVLGVLEYAGLANNPTSRNAGPDGIPGNGDDRMYQQDNNGDGQHDGLFYDRSPGAMWSDAPDNSISIGVDVLLVLAQAGHSCVAPP